MALYAGETLGSKEDTKKMRVFKNDWLSESFFKMDDITNGLGIANKFSVMIMK